MSDTGTLVYVVDDDVSAREGVARLICSAGLTAKLRIRDSSSSTWG